MKKCAVIIWVSSLNAVNLDYWLFNMEYILILLFHVGKLGPTYVYSFKNTVTTPAQITILSNRIRAYKNDNNRTIEHAKNILRRFGIRNID